MIWILKQFHDIDRFILVEFLHGELIAAQKIYNMSQNGETKTNLQPVYGILHAVNLSNPPSNISTQKLFSKIIERLHGMPENLKNHVICDSLWFKTLNESQWNQLNDVSLILCVCLINDNTLGFQITVGSE